MSFHKAVVAAELLCLQFWGGEGMWC